MNPDFGPYQLGVEHEALREAVRALATKEIAPHAKAIMAGALSPPTPASRDGDSLPRGGHRAWTDAP